MIFLYSEHMGIPCCTLRSAYFVPHSAQRVVRGYRTTSVDTRQVCKNVEHPNP